jgi:hypothetical protein
MAANCFVSCSDWLGVSKLLTGSGPKTDLAWHRWSTRSWFHIKTSLIGHIPRAWDGSAAATDEVKWLQTASFHAQIVLSHLDQSDDDNVELKIKTKVNSNCKNCEL